MGLTPSKLSSAHKSLILDASVLINILGTGCPDVILRAMRRVVTVDEITLREVNIDPATGQGAEKVLAQLQSCSLLKIIRMGDQAYAQFIGLTGAQPPDDLDDGEAATLAQAACSNYVAVIDERKATRISSSTFPKMPLLNSIDLLAAPELIDELGRDGLSDLIYLALRDSRMRVPPNARPWVMNLLGDKRAQDCPSLGCSPLRVFNRLKR
ncbi:MAG: hypothetical protein WBM14_01830 [Terracidiphilus sp.]